MTGCNWRCPVATDFDTFSTIFEFYLQTLDFNSARTVHYFNHTGIFYTETKTLFGAFAVGDYGSNASTRDPPKTLPPYLEANGYIHYDYGGSLLKPNRLGYLEAVSTIISFVSGQ